MKTLPLVNSAWRCKLDAHRIGLGRDAGLQVGKVLSRLHQRDPAQCLFLTRYVEAQRWKEQGQTDATQSSGLLSLLDLNNIATPADWLDLDQLAPSFIIRQAIQDWFELVHPVAPILHRDTFLRQLDDPSSSQDQDFAMLTVSICAATVSTLRRSAAPYAGMITVEKCHQIITTSNQARGALPITLIRSQTKYNMATSLTQERGMDNETVQLLHTEAMAMIGHLLHYKIQNLSTCDNELAKRLYWLCFAGQWSVNLLSNSRCLLYYLQMTLLVPDTI